MRGRKWLVANLTIEQSIYNFWTRTHLHRLVERLAVGAFKTHRRAFNVLRLCECGQIIEPPASQALTVLDICGHVRLVV
jgi:hypothetical protein